jgi:hypothetical protein
VRLGVVLFLRCCLVGWLYSGCLEGGGDSYSVITGYSRLRLRFCRRGHFVKWYVT